MANTEYRELLVGCGNHREKKVRFDEIPKDWNHLFTLDIDPNCRADFIHDLNVLPYPFEDNYFDEVHAYEILEHCGRQGDYDFFFGQFSEFWRILKPGGYFMGSCPNWDGKWAWGDPGHTRIISPESLVFLSQKQYEQVGETPMTDYRHLYKADFELSGYNEQDENWGFILRAIKDADESGNN